MKSFESSKSTSSTTDPFQPSSHLILSYPFFLPNFPSISPEVYGASVMFQSPTVGDYAFRVAESGT